MRVAVGVLGMLMSRLAVFTGSCGVRLCFVVLALRMLVSRLMMMSSRLMIGGGIVVMLA